MFYRKSLDIRKKHLPEAVFELKTFMCTAGDREVQTIKEEEVFITWDTFWNVRAVFNIYGDSVACKNRANPIGVAAITFTPVDIKDLDINLIFLHLSTSEKYKGGDILSSL